MVRPDYCPMANEPCQAMCEFKCGSKKPLTKDQIDCIIVDGSFHNAAGGIYAGSVYDFVEAIERAHNIGCNKKAR